MSGPESVPVGILSAAHPHAESYASALAENSGIEFVGIADENRQRGGTLARRYGTEHHTSKDLLDIASGVVVCSSNVTHRKQVERAATAGVDVLCEKPLATSHNTAQEIVEICETAGVRLGVAMPLRFSDPVCRARHALEAGDIGTVHAVTGTNRGQMPGSWFVEPERSGGGAVTDHTPHIVDLVHHLTGERVVEVYAESGTRFHDLAVEDVNLLSMKLSGDAQVTLDGSWSRPEEWPTWGGATLELLGTEGVLSIDCFDQTVEYVGSADGDVRWPFWGTDTDAALLADFAAAVRENRPPATTGYEGAAVVAVIDAAYRSIERNEPVTVEYATTETV